MKSRGFIILRHVNSHLTNKYWILCYRSIRKLYPDNKIIIIDDNSNYNFVSKIKLNNAEIIQSAFPKRGELLPYIYYLNNNFFDEAVILHDSVFVNKYIDFSVDQYKFIWEFDHNWDSNYLEMELISLFKNKTLLSFYNNKHQWKGCFGAMTIITHDYLNFVNSNFPLKILLDHVITRPSRCAFERVIACLFQYFKTKETLFGNIHKYGKWGGSGRGVGLENWHWNRKDSLLTQIKRSTHLPLIKVWSGR